MTRPLIVNAAGTAPARALAIVAEVADLWGGSWQPGSSLGSTEGTLSLPVTAGLRRGTVSGTLEIEATEDGSVLRFEQRESEYYLLWPAVFFLVLASAGGLFSMVWPFFAHSRPELLTAAPLAFFLAVGGWLLVVARLRNSGPEEFLEEVTERLSPPKVSE